MDEGRDSERDDLDGVRLRSGGPVVEYQIDIPPVNLWNYTKINYWRDEMTEYNPESWVIIKIINDKTDKVLYKVFGSWRGNFVNSDSWRLNSGITKVEEQENCYIFYGASGSAYYCYKEAEGTPMGSYNTSVLDRVVKQLNSKDGITAEVVKATEIRL